LISSAALKETSTRVAPKGSAIIISRVSVGKYAIADDDYAINQDLTALVASDEDRLVPEYLQVVAPRIAAEVKQGAQGIGVRGVTRDFLARLRLPLPPTDVQRGIVVEMSEYRRIIDGARLVLENYHPRILVDPDWPRKPLAEVCEIQRGRFSHRPRNEPRFYDGDYPFIQTGDIARARGGKIAFTQTLNEEGLSVSKLFQPPIVVITIAANIGDTAVLDFPSCFPDSVVGLIPKQGLDARYLELVMRTKKEHLNRIAPQSAQKNINIEILKSVEVPVPPLAAQQAIVGEIGSEQALVDANAELIARTEEHVASVLARLWGEDALCTTDA
jgi:restriction endonuclease S subunit